MPHLIKHFGDGDTGPVMCTFVCVCVFFLCLGVCVFVRVCVLSPIRGQHYCISVIVNNNTHGQSRAKRVLKWSGSVELLSVFYL